LVDSGTIKTLIKTGTENGCLNLMWTGENSDFWKARPRFCSFKYGQRINNYAFSNGKGVRPVKTMRGRSYFARFRPNESEGVL